jgi:hypothetical protein
MTKGYFMTGFWGARIETPNQIAPRFLRHIDLLREIDPLFALWISGSKGPRKLETIRDRFVKEIEAGISRDDYGDPDPVDGYWFGAYTRGYPNPFSYSVNGNAGAWRPSVPTGNAVIFETASQSIPDPAAITYPIFKSALLALVEAWDPVDCYASSDDLLDLLPRPERHEHFREAWMQYLSAPLARLIAPPSSAINDWLPNGGLLMSATNETFRVDNPAHLAAARDIAAATAPLNALPL